MFLKSKIFVLVQLQSIFIIVTESCLSFAAWHFSSCLYRMCLTVNNVITPCSRFYHASPCCFGVHLHIFLQMHVHPCDAGPACFLCSMTALCSHGVHTSILVFEQWLWGLQACGNGTQG